MRPQFIKDRVSDLLIFEKHVGKLMSHINGQGQEVDVADLFYRLTLDSATDYLLGKSVNSLDDPHIEFASAFAEVQRGECLLGAVSLLAEVQVQIPDIFQGDELEIRLQSKANFIIVTVQNTIAGSGPFSPLVPKKTYVSHNCYNPLSC